MRIKRLSALLLSALLITSPIGYMTVNGDICAESGAESMTGQIAVGNVILNRVKSSQFPDTVEGVIFDRKDAVQFEPVSNRRVYLPPTSQSVEAAKRALDGENVVGSALYFYAPALSQGTWINANRPYQQTIGCHRFYR